jgi:hypothetical protein
LREKMQERKISEFKAATEAGKEYTVCEYQEQLGITPYREEILGFKRLATSGGLKVVYNDPNTFRIVETGEIIRKV